MSSRIKGLRGIEGLRERTRAHPLAAFFVIAFSISWFCWLAVFAILDLEFVPWSIPGTFGPALAALLVTRALEGRAGVRALMRRLVLWRVGVRWYLFALVGLPAVAVAGYAFAGDPLQNVDHPAYVVGLMYVSSLLILMLLGGGQEEPGWRGFALPRMQVRSGPLKGAVLLGVIWGVWQLPLFAFVPDYVNADPGFVNTAAMFLAFTASSRSGCP